MNANVAALHTSYYGELAERSRERARNLNAQRSERMLSLAELASRLETTSKHDFGLTDRTGTFTHPLPSPKLSAGNQYYFTCSKCQRVVFEGGTGSAVTSNCS
jgi:hypothetical protein